MCFKLFILFKRYCRDSKAVAAMESAFIFPVMLTMLFGIVDIGTSVIINTKVISATQIASDLLTRSNVADDTAIQEARLAAEAAMIPYYDPEDFGIDIAAIRFSDPDAMPEEQWRDTFNMDPNLAAVDEAYGLGLEGEGLIIVTVEYRYTPRFSEFLAGEIIMREVSFARGRDNTFVERN